MVRIHLDDQMDSKGLMGAYICTARPGEFVWQPGPLTQVRGSGQGHRLLGQKDNMLAAGRRDGDCTAKR